MMSSPAGLNGARGRVAFANPENRTVRVETPDSALCRDTLGGRGGPAVEA